MSHAIGQLSRFRYDSLRRSVLNLPPTVAVTPRGAPSAKFLNLEVTSASHGEDHHDDHAAANPLHRADADIPRWSTRAGISASGLMAVTGAVNANPTPYHQSRTFSTSSRALQSEQGPHVPRTSVETDAGWHSEMPDYSKYKKASETSARTFSYFAVGAMGLISAAGTKSLVSDFLQNMSASADVLALAKVEVDMNSIPEGKNVIIKWRGKPVFVRHRTKAEIDEANAVDIKTLRDPQKDSDRTQKPEWLVMLGVCTHLGCVPIGEAGDYGGWYCPCHGSHYDISGRVRRGPAPLNLEVPQYSFGEDDKLIIG